MIKHNLTKLKEGQPRLTSVTGVVFRRIKPFVILYNKILLRFKSFPREDKINLSVRFPSSFHNYGPGTMAHSLIFGTGR